MLAEEDFDARLDQHEKLVPAIFMGANEVHVHLLAHSRAERLRIETDLRRGQLPPLNEQSSGPDSSGGLLASLLVR
jgi:hypothetical protein